MKIKLTILLIALAVISCQKEDDFSKQDTTITQDKVIDRKVIDIHKEDIPGNIIQHIAFQRASYIPYDNQNRSSSTQSDNPFGTIDFDQVKAIVNDQQATDKTYTFNIDSHPHITRSFTNLIVRVKNGSIVRSYINRYKPTDTHFNNKQLQFDNTFSGTLESFTFEETADPNQPLIAIETKTFDSGTVTSVSLNEDCQQPDSDADGVPDTLDNCPNHANSDQADADNDGFGDACDSTPNGNNDDTSGNGNPDDGQNPDDGSTDTGDGLPSDDTGNDDTGNGGIGDCDVSIQITCCSNDFCEPHGPRPIGGGEYCSGTGAIVIDCAGMDFTDPNTTTSENTTLQPCPNDDIVVIDPRDTPCNNLTALTVNNASVRLKLKELRQVDIGKEQGFEIRKNPENNSDSATNLFSGNSACSEVNITYNSGIAFAGAHSHPDSCGVYGMFSAGDVLNLAKIQDKYNGLGKDHYNTYTFILTTTTDTYAIKFNNNQAMVKLKEIYNDDDERDDFYKRFKKNFKRLGNNPTEYNMMKRLLSIFNDFELEIDLYEAVIDNSNFVTGWEKKTLENDDITTTPCN